MPTLLVGNGSALLVGARRRSVAPSLIGCGPVGCVVGAEALAEASGVWFKAHFHRQGPFLCATVYSVSAGEPKVVELRIDIRPIARSLLRAHAALHAKSLAEGSLRGEGGAVVGWGLGSLFKGAKKAAATIGRSKLVRGVTNVVKKVVRSPVVQVLNPSLALGAHTMSRAAGGKGVFKGALGKIVDSGTGAVLSMVPGGAVAAAPLVSRLSTSTLGAYAAANQALAGVEMGQNVFKTAQSASSLITQGKRAARAVATTNQRTAAAVKTAGALMPAAARSKVAARVKAAGTLKLNAKGKAVVAGTLAKTPAAARAKVASAVASKLKGLATLKSRAALAQALPPTASAAVVNATRLQVAASPLIARAKAAAARFADPKVQARLTALRAQGVKSEAALRSVAAAAKGGNLDAQKSAAIINLVARNRARIQGMSQTNAGGLPGLLITKDGKLRRGRWRVQATAAAGGTLYTGPRKPTERGTFQTVSGGPVFIGRLGLTDFIAGANSPVAFVGRAVALIGSTLESIAVNGELPLDGTRVFGKGANQSPLGVYESDEVSGTVSRALIGCGAAPCVPCSAAG